jgi:crotonobetaine/carnitine-CoA ligase
MFDGYFNAPRETLACYRNLWFHTGDNGRLDEDGYFYFVDRKKDVIRRRGENISSHEFESVMLQHPAVEDCAAIAAASEVGEDEVKLVLVVRSGLELTAADIWAFCEARMPRFWVPRYVEFRRELPKTPTQKVQKYLLRQAPAEGPVFDRLAPKAVPIETPTPTGLKQ